MNIKGLVLLCCLALFGSAADAKSYGSGGGSKSSSSSSSSSKYGSGGGSKSSGSKYGSGGSAKPSSPSPSPSLSPSAASSWDSTSQAAKKAKSAKDYEAYKKKNAPPPQPLSAPSPSPAPRTVYRMSAPRTVVEHHYYRDPRSGYWDGYMTNWLLMQSLDTRTSWMYNHRSEFSDQQYREMMAKDAQLQARVSQLEAQGVKRDPTIAVATPPPQADETVQAPPDAEIPAGPDTNWGFWTWALILALVGGIGYVGYRTLGGKL